MGMAIMEVLLPVIFLNVCGMLLKAKFGLDGAESYLIALMGVLSFLYIGGIFNLLLPAAAGIFIGILLLLLAAVKKSRSQKRSLAAVCGLKEYFNPFVLLNNLSCLVFTVIFSISNPLFYYWDELAFWGTSAKATKLLDRLYSIWPTPLHNHLPPSNALLNYFFNFFSVDFQPYILLLSYAFLFFAVFSVVAELAYRKSGSLPFAVVTYVLLLLSPFMCVAHKELLNYESLLYAYGTAMVDFNIAVVFLSAIALYLSSPAKKWYLLSLVFLVNMKNTGVFFALIAVCVILCLAAFDAQAGKRLTETVKNGALMLLVVVLAYGSWFVHLSAFELAPAQPVVLQDPAYLQEQEELVRVDETIDQNVLSILVPPLRSERYNAVMETMRKAFLLEKSNLFMPDRYFAAVLVAAGALVSVLSSRGKRLRALCVLSGIAVGCYVYCAVISYFISYYRDDMIEYPRYMSSYYFLWVYTIILLAVTGENGRRGKQTVFCAVSLVTLLLIGKTGLDYTSIDAPDTPYLEYMETEQYVRQIKGSIEKDDKVYLVLPDQYTWEYIKYGYHLLPAICNQDTKGTGIDFTISFREKLEAGSDRRYYNIASPQLYARLMTEYFDYVYVVRPDEEFRESYSHLFSDGMTEGTLYKITEQNVPMQVV